MENLLAIGKRERQVVGGSGRIWPSVTGNNGSVAGLTEVRGDGRLPSLPRRPTIQIAPRAVKRVYWGGFIAAPNFDLNVKSTVSHPPISVAKACRAFTARHQFWLDAIK